MTEDWSQEEVELTVASYLGMLTAELRGEDYSKAETWKALMRLLPQRSKGAIEFKYGNISAVLLELGLPYVRGYKPYRNYQGLLFDAVATSVAGNAALVATARDDALRPAMVPSVDDILAAMVEPPARERADRTSEERTHGYTAKPRRPRPAVNYLELEARNSSLGRAGEEFALRYEQAKLITAGAERLAARVEHVALTRGDGLGYDILSFEPNGAERLVEVKTTKYGPATPFFVSRTELAVSKESAAQYRLYRLFDFREQPRLFSLSGSLSDACDLSPHSYEGRVA